MADMKQSRFVICAYRTEGRADIYELFSFHQRGRWCGFHFVITPVHIHAMTVLYILWSGSGCVAMLIPDMGYRERSCSEGKRMSCATYNILEVSN